MSTVTELCVPPVHGAGNWIAVTLLRPDGRHAAHGVPVRMTLPDEPVEAAVEEPDPGRIEGVGRSATEDCWLWPGSPEAVWPAPAPAPADRLAATTPATCMWTSGVSLTMSPKPGS